MKCTVTKEQIDDAIKKTGEGIRLNALFGHHQQRSLLIYAKLGLAVGSNILKDIEEAQKHLDQVPK